MTVLNQKQDPLEVVVEEISKRNSANLNDYEVSIYDGSIILSWYKNHCLINLIIDEDGDIYCLNNATSFKSGYVDVSVGVSFIENAILSS